MIFRILFDDHLQLWRTYSSSSSSSQQDLHSIGNRACERNSLSLWSHTQSKTLCYKRTYNKCILYADVRSMFGMWVFALLSCLSSMLLISLFTMEIWDWAVPALTAWDDVNEGLSDMAVSLSNWLEKLISCTRESRLPLWGQSNNTWHFFRTFRHPTPQPPGCDVTYFSIKNNRFKDSYAQGM